MRRKKPNVPRAELNVEEKLRNLVKDNRYGKS